MPSSTDLAHHATTSSTDFYALLSTTPETSQRDLDRAWRKTALKYHPDKVGPSGDRLAAAERFHLAQIGYDLLSDPASKAIYDNARRARLQRSQRDEMFEGRRRRMKDELERREGKVGLKRGRDEGDAGGDGVEDEEERLRREIGRLAEDGKRRRKEREDALRREIERDADADAADGKDAPASGEEARAASTGVSGGGVSELDRTVKVRWPVEGAGGTITADRVKEVFSKFGKVESADLLNSKMLKLGSSKRKQLAIVCMVLYASVVGAHAAVEDFPKQSGDEWQVFDSVYWAANKEPDFINGQRMDGGESPSRPSTPITPTKDSRRASNPFAALRNGNGATPGTSSSTVSEGLKKKPSFASFSPAAFNTPKGSPFGKGLGPNSPSLEEMTMIRLREAEKRRLAAEIQKQDEEADAAAAAVTAST